MPRKKMLGKWNSFDTEKAAQLKKIKRALTRTRLGLKWLCRVKYWVRREPGTAALSTLSTVEALILNCGLDLLYLEQERLKLKGFVANEARDY